MRSGLVTILSVVLVGSVGESFGDEREPLQHKRRMAPIRGRQLNPARAEQRERDEAAEWKREQDDRQDRHDRKGGGDKDDADDE
jgi:hypothetical protein